MKYETLIEDAPQVIEAASDEEASAQLRTMLKRHIEAQFADARRRGRYISVPQVTVTADASLLNPDGDIDYSADEVEVEVTLAVPADIYRA